MKRGRSFRLFLEDMSLAMAKIEEYTRGQSYYEFLNDSRTVDAVIRNFEVIGESARNIPAEIKAKYPNVPWDEMYLLRNKVTHEYFGIDHMIIWDVLTNHLPANRVDIDYILLKEPLD